MRIEAIFPFLALASNEILAKSLLRFRVCGTCGRSSVTAKFGLDSQTVVFLSLSIDIFGATVHEILVGLFWVRERHAVVFANVVVENLDVLHLLVEQ